MITELIRSSYFDENDRVEELVQESHSSSENSDEEEMNDSQI